MSRMAMFGLVLIVVGILMLAWPVISYTDRDEVVDIGPIEITTENRESVAIPPILGGIVIAAGIVMMVAGRRPSRV